MKKNKSKMLTVKGAILDKNMLCQYLEKLASEQIIKSCSDEKTNPISNLRNNFKFICTTYQLLNEHAKLKITIDPAGEWLLDNFYILEEVVKSIERDLTPRKYRNFVGMGNGIYRGFARIYVLASEIMAYTDGKVEEETIKIFLKAYQNKKALTIEEIWNLPTFIQIAAIQNIREICEKIYDFQIQKYKAESIIERLVDKKEKNLQIFNGQIKHVKYKKESMNYAFIEYLSYKLKSYGKRGAPYLQILEEQVEKMGTTVTEVIKQVHFSLAVNKVTIGNLITSIKEISRTDFSDVAKEISEIEEILRQDPAGVYCNMDYKTKSDYQSRIQELARKTNISELYIARTLLELAQKNVENKTEKDTKMQEKKNHIGYYLLEEPNLLYQRLEINKKELNKEQRAKLYMSINIILPLYLCFVFFVFLYIHNRKFIFSILASIILYLPLTEILIQCISYLLGKFVKPTRIPKMNYQNGVPKESTTFIVIPTILNNSEKVRKLMKKLEVYYLANQSENLYLGLLGDVTAGKSEEEEFDNEIISTGIEEIKRLNSNYPVEDGIPRFHFLYRKRTWNPKEASFLGWERKRGLLIQFNEFLRKPEKSEFRYNSIEELRKPIPKIKYIITLDADTNLVLDSGLELIGAMSHILNTPVVAEGRVTKGHAMMQPRVGVDLQSSSASIFSKIMALPGGTDLYTNAVSDVYQDNFGEGIFTGKGIYNLDVFSEIVTGQVPENMVLSHDLLEGNYLRCALVSDVMLLDGFPSKYNSYMVRMKRWIRGDWQIMQWLLPQIVNRNGNYEKNPLNPLSKFKIWDNMRRSLIPISIFFTLLLGISTTYNGWLTCAGLVGIFITTLLAIIDKIIFKKEIEDGFISASKNFLWKVSGVTGILYQNLLELAFLPHKAYTALTAISKTLYRVFISKKNLLEWLTAEEAEKQAKTTCKSYYYQMTSNIVAAVILFILALHGNLFQIIAGALLAIIWSAGPYIAYQISKPIIKVKSILKLNEEEKQYLKEIARRTWDFFDCYINSENNYLPPDNFQENRKKAIATRTSPTNIGLGLLSIVSAMDFEFITFSKGIELLEKSMNTIENLCKWNGHLYNWYNTLTLEPLNPKYISTVDSGNFVRLFICTKTIFIK